MASTADVQEHLTSFKSWFASASRVTVAYSGGLDSHVLLHALASWLEPGHLQALHINHQLSPQADSWQAHCAEICANLQVAFISRKITVSTSGSLETAAREARYRVFVETLRKGELLLLAHHANDQAETVLFRLMRRHGARGLAGMPVSRPLGAGRLLRPLLGLKREALRDYALHYRLQWVEDESNVSLQHDRNYLRHRVMPVLTQRWPDLVERINTAADRCRTAADLSDTLARADLSELLPRDERLGWSVDMTRLLALNSERRGNVLHYLVRDKALKTCSAAVVAEVERSLYGAACDANPQVAWSGGSWRRYRQRLYLLPPVKGGEGVMANLTSVDLAWPEAQSLLLPDGGRLYASKAQGAGLAARFEGGLHVRFRRGGERCRPANRSASAPLKKLFQEAGLEPWLRERVPLVYAGDELAAVGDLWINRGFEARESEPGFRLHWHLSQSASPVKPDMVA